MNASEILRDDFWNINLLQCNDFNKWSEEIANEMEVELEKAKAVDCRKQQLFNLLFGSNESFTVQELSFKMFWNSQQINRYFKSRFGLTI